MLHWIVDQNFDLTLEAVDPALEDAVKNSGSQESVRRGVKVSLKGLTGAQIVNQARYVRKIMTQQDFFRQVRRLKAEIARYEGIVKGLENPEKEYLLESVKLLREHSSEYEELTMKKHSSVSALFAEATACADLAKKLKKVQSRFNSESALDSMCEKDKQELYGIRLVLQNIGKSDVATRLISEASTRVAELHKRLGEIGGVKRSNTSKGSSSRSKIQKST